MTNTYIRKKFVILPMILVTGIVAVAVFTTETSAVLLSVNNNINTVALDSQQVGEQLQAKTSLTYLSDKISSLNFVKSNNQYLRGTSVTLALR